MRAVVKQLFPIIAIVGGGVMAFFGHDVIGIVLVIAGLFSL